VPHKKKGQLSLDLLASLFPTLLILTIFIYSVPIQPSYGTFEKSRLAVALGDRFILSCRAAECDERVHPNTWNSSVVLDVEKIAGKTGLDFQIGDLRKGEPTYFVPRVVHNEGLKVIWFGVG